MSPVLRLQFGGSFEGSCKDCFKDFFKDAGSFEASFKDSFAGILLRVPLRQGFWQDATTTLPESPHRFIWCLITRLILQWMVGGEVGV